ncbi:MAG: DMT family transporter [Gomphosphaeria aponina SAG 52.96 = DSM 107014]|uniref:DMT family transporter n=1 Tax=Gomphosphaeria aponina SAG 52.96 = DSM 107014 TaxID=1521640 RepID=A0A941GQH6_9CHRO|nr:DMT family transporter [Gomphosphaeria aponina SAG 52.96 = DSM 107014]
MWINDFKGELAALSAAFLWAASSAVYGLLGPRIPPLQLNLLKGLIAIAFICLTLVLSGELQIKFNLVTVGLFLISGILGIGLGDTAYFIAINNLGARRTLLMETLAPPMTALLALIFLGEKLSFGAWCGILITGIGVGWVITERTQGSVISTANGKKGIIWAILSEVAQSSGVIISRFALVSSEINPLWSTLLRLIGGTIIVVFLLLVKGKKQSESGKINWSGKLVGAIAITAFGSTYLGIWLQQTSLKFAPAGIAQTLLATSPLFVIPIAARLGERISVRSILGVLIAVAGIGLLFTFR